MEANPKASTARLSNVMNAKFREFLELAGDRPPVPKKATRASAGAKESTPKESKLPPLKIRISARKRKRNNDSDDGGGDSDEEFNNLLKEHEKNIDEQEKQREERRAARKAAITAKKAAKRPKREEVVSFLQ